MTGEKYKDNDKDKQVTCDISDTEYNSDNWEPEIMTNFAIWQLRVTLDSIRNSCDVFFFFTVLDSQGGDPPPKCDMWEKEQILTSF